MTQPEDTIDAGGAITDLVFNENYKMRFWRFSSPKIGVPRSEVV